MGHIKQVNASQKKSTTDDVKKYLQQYQRATSGYPVNSHRQHLNPIRASTQR
jgi:hypothetical protein